MRTFARVTLIGGALLAATALLRRWLEEQSAPSSSSRSSTAPAPSAPSSSKSSRGSNGTQDGASRKQLYERARELEIEGRSKMSKAELAEAVARSESG